MTGHHFHRRWNLKEIHHGSSHIYVVVYFQMNAVLQVNNTSVTQIKSATKQSAHFI